MGVLGYREGGARACVESLLREGSEASGHELDHGDVDSGFRSLRASLKVFAQPAFKGFAQVTPQTAVDGLARTVSDISTPRSLRCRGWVISVRTRAMSGRGNGADIGAR